MKGEKRSDLNATMVRAMKSSKARIFTTTRNVLTVALSRVPAISMAATATTMTIAGRLTTPPAMGPDRSAAGTWTPTDSKNPTAYPDHPTATAPQTTEYSRMRLQPTIQARNSPITEYVYVYALPAAGIIDA